MICPKCGTPNRASAKFCDECGYELPSVAPIANEMFDDSEHVQTCKPKAAPTADLNGVDKTNDSSFDEHKKDEEKKQEEAFDSDITAVIEPLKTTTSRTDNDENEQISETDVLDTQKTAKMEVVEPKTDADESKAKLYSVNNDADKKQKETF